jgi:hypothetical protein
MKLSKKKGKTYASGGETKGNKCAGEVIINISKEAGMENVIREGEYSYTEKKSNKPRNILFSVVDCIANLIWK